MKSVTKTDSKTCFQFKSLALIFFCKCLQKLFCYFYRKLDEHIENTNFYTPPYHTQGSKGVLTNKVTCALVCKLFGFTVAGIRRTLFPRDAHQSIFSLIKNQVVHFFIIPFSEPQTDICCGLLKVLVIKTLLNFLSIQLKIRRLEFGTKMLFDWKNSFIS